MKRFVDYWFRDSYSKYELVEIVAYVFAAGFFFAAACFFLL